MALVQNIGWTPWPGICSNPDGRSQVRPRDTYPSCTRPTFRMLLRCRALLNDIELEKLLQGERTAVS